MNGLSTIILPGQNQGLTSLWVALIHQDVGVSIDEVW
jgi:hypothetical protein